MYNPSSVVGPSELLLPWESEAAPEVDALHEHLSWAAVSSQPVAKTLAIVP
jgi:hypothetical protein